MPKGGIWIALLLLALVGGGIGYLVYQDNQKPADPPPSDTRVFPEGLKELSAIRLEREGDPPVVLRASGPDSWEIEEPARYLADTVEVGNLVGALRTLDADRVLELTGGDPREFGLHAPMLRIGVSEGEETQTIEVGGVNPTGESRYLRLQGSPKLYLVGMATINALNKSLAGLREKRVIATGEFGARGISIEGPRETRQLVRRENRDWTFQQPEEFYADQGLISGMVGSVLMLRTDAAALSAAPLAEARFRALPLYARLKVSTEDKEHTAELRGEPGGVYAKSEALGGIYPVPAEIDNYLRKPLEEFRDLRVFRFGFSEIFKLRYEGGGKSFSLDKPNENWVRDGKRVEAQLANTLVDELRGLRGTEYLVGEAPGEVTHTAAVELADGAEETVTLRKDGDNYFAARAGEKGYYRLPASFLKGIESAAGGIAP